MSLLFGVVVTVTWMTSLLFVAMATVIMLLFVSGHKRSADGTSRTASVRSIHVCRKVDVRAMSNRTLSTTASSLAYCARRCVADSTCSSFNWKKSDRLCELVSNYGKPPVYRANTDYIHYGPDVCPVRPTIMLTYVSSSYPGRCMRPQEVTIVIEFF